MRAGVADAVSPGACFGSSTHAGCGGPLASRLVRVNPITVNDVLDGHVQLDLDCWIRLYLHGYLGQLQVGGQVAVPAAPRVPGSLTGVSAADRGRQARRSVASFADANHIPVVRLKSTDRNIDLMRRYLSRLPGKDVRSGRDRGCSGTAAGVHRRRRDTDLSKPHSPSTRRTAGHRSLLLPVGRRFRSGVHQGLHLRHRGRSRSGSTATNGPNAKPPRPGSGSPSCPTGSPPPTTPPHCRPSAIASGRAPSACSSNAGWPGCRCHWARPTPTRATGGVVDGPGRGVPHPGAHPAPLRAAS